MEGKILTTGLSRWKYAIAAVVFVTLGMSSRQPPAPPRQPIAFPHVRHVAAGLQCMDCHQDAATSPQAGLPSTQECALCHQKIAPDSAPVREVLGYARLGEEIPWQPVYTFLASAHVRFRHDMHVKAGIACSSCHGDVAHETTAKVATPLNMGVCVSCHKLHDAPTECQTCHY